MSILDVTGGKGRITTHSGEDRGTHIHHGIDIGGIEQGSDLYSRVAGSIVSIKKDEENKTAGGTSVTIRGDDGRIYTYRHLAGVSLKEGDKVSKGQVFAQAGGERGKAGSGSSTTGTHVHEEVRDTSGRHINPETNLPFNDKDVHRNTYKYAAERGLKQDARTREETPERIVETEVHRQASIFGGKPGQKADRTQHTEVGQTREKTPTEAVILFTEDLSEAQMDLQQSGSNFANWAGELLRERRWYEFGRA